MLLTNSLTHSIYNDPNKPHFPYLWNESNYIHSVELITRFKGDGAHKVTAPFGYIVYKIIINEIQGTDMYVQSISIKNTKIHAGNLT